MIRIFKASRFTRVDRLTKIPYASRLAQGGGMIKTQYINCSGWTRFICYNSQQKMLFWQRCFVPFLVRLAVLNKFGADLNCLGPVPVLIVVNQPENLLKL